MRICSRASEALLGSEYGNKFSSSHERDDFRNSLVEEDKVRSFIDETRSSSADTPRLPKTVESQPEASFSSGTRSTDLMPWAIRRTGINRSRRENPYSGRP
jgi:hypothetical protein